jgi:nucleotide-binding universal stress UspA family protein
MLPYKRIVSSTDFSEASRNGVRTAVELAQHFDAELILVHVQPELRTVAGATTISGYHLPSVQEEMKAETTELIQRFMREEIPETVRSRFHIAHGSTAAEIVRTAEESHADIIVMSTQGESGWKGLFFGSVAERVVRTAPCPVMTVREAGEEAP